MRLRSVVGSLLPSMMMAEKAGRSISLVSITLLPLTRLKLRDSWLSQDLKRRERRVGSVVSRVRLKA